jgi:hypothetical protein
MGAGNKILASRTSGNLSGVAHVRPGRADGEEGNTVIPQSPWVGAVPSATKSLGVAYSLAWVVASTEQVEVMGLKRW